MTDHPALQLIGSPYLRGGESPEEGFDCFTLLEYVRREYFRRPTPHAGIPAPELTSAQAAALGIYRALGGREATPGPWVAVSPAETLANGAAVALGRSRVNRLHHCGVFISGGVLHALDNVGVVYTPLDRLSYLYARAEFFECPTFS